MYWQAPKIESSVFDKEAYLLTDVLHCFGLSMRKDNRELFATITAYNIRVASRVLQDSSNSEEYEITCEMTVGIVNVLEMVHV